MLAFDPTDNRLSPGPGNVNIETSVIPVFGFTIVLVGVQFIALTPLSLVILIVFWILSHPNELQTTSLIL